MPFITRSFYCENPYRHRESLRHFVWGGTRNCLLVYDTKFQVVSNITPHIISFNGLVNGKINIAVSCGCEGCGIQLNDPDDLDSGVVFLEIRNYQLSEREWKALYNFKNTGFELI